MARKFAEPGGRADDASSTGDPVANGQPRNVRANAGDAYGQLRSDLLVLIADRGQPQHRKLTRGQRSPRLRGPAAVHLSAGDTRTRHQILRVFAWLMGQVLVLYTSQRRRPQANRAGP